MSARSLLPVLFLVLVNPMAAQAKRSSPELVAPIEVGGISYKVPNFGSSHRVDQNGGYVQAWDIKNHKLLWDRMVYRLRPNDWKEGDVQDVFITSVRVKGQKL